MILGRLAQTNLPLLTTSTGTIERVTSFKLYLEFILTLRSPGQPTLITSLKRQLVGYTLDPGTAAVSRRRRR